jgi:hypothetical protein
VDVLAWVERTARSESKSESALVNEILRVGMDGFRGSVRHGGRGRKT